MHPALRATRASALVITFVVAGACGAASSPSTVPTRQPSATPSPLVAAQPSAIPSPVSTIAPTPAPQVGLAWLRVDDRDVTSRPQDGSMTGVIAGGPGAIAWGSIYGAGPLIWTTADGRDWTPAIVERPKDADPSQNEPGSVQDVTAFGSGYVAIGSYFAQEVTPLVWTSSDGMTWRLAPDEPILDHMLLGERIVAWGTGLLAFGCELASQTDCGPARVFASDDGIGWTVIAPVLPKGIGMVDFNDASADRLWGRGPAAGDQYWPLLTEDTPKPVRLGSLDGRAWTTETLPILGLERLHALPGGLYLTVSAPANGPGFAPGPTWLADTPSIQRSTDSTTWEPLVVGQKLGDEIAAIGDTLIMVGSAEPCVQVASRCDAGAWRSTDGGRTWTAAPVSPNPPGVTRAGMSRVAALPDGTLVAVGQEGGKDGTNTAIWISPPGPLVR